MDPITIGAGALMLLAGVGIGYWLGNSGRARETEKADGIQAELDDYRRRVTDHFSTTAGHFQAIGDEYRKLYGHMAAGAGALCDPGQAGQVVSFESAELLAEAPPPRDFDAAPLDDSEVGFSEIATKEPSDGELVEIQSAEELLTEPEVAVENVDSEKTLH
jgi:uncharacterized membrane-anchored protein YhcB (DUF1043 family)